MMLMGQIKKAGRWWEASVPIAEVHTQGRTRKDAAAMIADAFESLVNRPGFKVTVTEIGTDAAGKVLVSVDSTDPWALASYVLKVQREMNGVSIAQAAAALGQRSKTAYARYEQGRVVPTIEKYVALLEAVAPNMRLTIGESGPARRSRRARLLRKDVQTRSGARR